MANFTHLIAAAVAVVTILGLAPAQAQQCPSPAYENRLIRGITAQDKTVRPALNERQIGIYARCKTRRICAAGLDRVEFEMYALSALIAVGDAAADREAARRMKRDGRKDASAMEKIKNPNGIDDACMAEAKSR